MSMARNRPTESATTTSNPRPDHHLHGNTSSDVSDGKYCVTSSTRNRMACSRASFWGSSAVNTMLRCRGHIGQHRIPPAAFLEDSKHLQPSGRNTELLTARLMLERPASASDSRQSSQHRSCGIPFDMLGQPIFRTL